MSTLCLAQRKHIRQEEALLTYHTTVVTAVTRIPEEGLTQPRLGGAGQGFPGQVPSSSGVRHS